MLDCGVGVTELAELTKGLGSSLTPVGGIGRGMESTEGPPQLVDAALPGIFDLLWIASMLSSYNLARPIA